MNFHDETISKFKEFAASATEKHATSIKQEYAGTANNEERLRIFQFYMDSLKNTLSGHVVQLGGQDPALVQKLQIEYKDFVNEFYKKEF